MKIDENYDGPTVAVLCTDVMGFVGRVTSVHADRDGAALALAELIAASETTGQGWQILTVPAPFLADEPARRTGGGALGPQLWAALQPLGIAEDADEGHMIGRVRDLVGEVLDGDAVPDPTEPKLNGLEAAYRAEYARRTNEPWENAAGLVQRTVVALVDRIVRAYLAGLVDDDSVA